MGDESAAMWVLGWHTQLRGRLACFLSSFPARHGQKKQAMVGACVKGDRMKNGVKKSEEEVAVEERRAPARGSARASQQTKEIEEKCSNRRRKGVI